MSEGMLGLCAILIWLQVQLTEDASRAIEMVCVARVIL